MIEEKKIAQNYVSSLYNLAHAQKKEKQILTDLQQLTCMIKENEKLVDILASPIIASDKKNAVMSDVLSKMKLHEISRRFFATIIKHDRIKLLEVIAKMFLAQYQEQHNVKTVHVTAAQKLSKSAAKLLQDHLEKRLGMGVEMSVQIDESIIGGARVSYDSMMLDFSTAGALVKIEKTLQNS